MDEKKSGLRDGLKVLHIIPSVSPFRGGPSSAVLEMANSLNKIGVEAEIATTDDNLDCSTDKEKEVKINWKGAPTYFFPRIISPSKAVNEFCFSLAFVRWLSKNINNYDVLHAHAVFSFLPSHALLISKKRRIPCVLRTMGHLDEWSLSRSSIKKKVALALWERSRLLSASYIHTTSDAEAENVRRVLGNKVEVGVIPLGIKVPEGVDLSQTEARKLLGLNMNDKLIIFQSRIHPKKRIDFLLEVLHKISFAKLVIAGSGDKSYEEYLLKMVNSMGLNDRVIWLGWLDGNKRGAVLKAGDVFVLPSFSENFGLSAVEAAACGIPVVLSHHVDAGKRLAQLGASIICKDHQYVSVIKDILCHPQNYKYDSDAVRREFDWLTVARRLESIYFKISKKNYHEN